MAHGPSDSEPSGTKTPSRAYASYVLVVLVVVYVFNFIDRQILSILAEEIKADLGLSDAAIGFRYGTAFAVFYAIFGIPLGRLADVWVRKNIIAVGLFFWSAMTSLSGTARGFVSLTGYRIGVGVGESSASPAAFSLLGDYFPPRLRATVLSIYSSGVYIGAGLGIFLGGLIVDAWNRAFADGGAPFGLAGWQAAFFAVGIPGLVLAAWVWTLREPVRGQSEGLTSPGPSPSPLRELVRELMSVLPLVNWISLVRSGAGWRGIGFNLLGGGACALAAWGLVALFGSASQWIALMVGLYAFFSWAQGLALRDPPAFTTIFKSRALVLGIVGFALIAFAGYGLGFWIPPFFLRVHGVSTSEAGTVLGLSAAAAGWLGITAGGIVSDSLKRRTPRARLYAGLGCALVSVPAAVFLLASRNLYAAYVLNFVFQMVSPFWIGSAIALANELVLPRMRATASAFYILVVTFLGLALGPYTIGRLSDVLSRRGAPPGDALRSAMLLALLVYLPVLVFLWLSSRTVEDEERNRLDRARGAGELI